MQEILEGIRDVKAYKAQQDSMLPMILEATTNEDNLIVALQDGRTVVAQNVVGASKNPRSHTKIHEEKTFFFYFYHHDFEQLRRTLIAPLAWYPRLLHGTETERKNWRLIGDTALISQIITHA